MVEKPRSRLMATAEGFSVDAFGASEWGLFLLVGSAWGSSFLFIDVALDSLAPGVVTFLRLGLGALTLAALRKPSTRYDRSDWLRTLMLGVIWLALPETLLPLAQGWINSAVTGMLVGAVPVVTALVSSALLRRPPGTAQIVGILLGLVGVALISVASITDGETGWLGVIAVLLAVVLYGLSANLVAPLQQKHGSVVVMSRVLIVGTAFTIPYAAIGLPNSSISATGVASVVVLGGVATGLAFVAYGTLIGRAGATRASGVTYMIPVVALTLGVWLRNDEVEPVAYLGCACVVAAIFFVSRQGR